MTRLFAVPLLIISVILGCAVVVVLLFGSITGEQERSIDSLLTTLEASSGEKTAGVLLPREKELWQVARELALRLGKKETELTSDELAEVVERLSALLQRESARSEQLSPMGRKKMNYVMTALSRTESAKAVEPLVGVLGDRDARTRIEALRALGELREAPEARRALPRILAVLPDADAAVRAATCVLVSSLAEPGDVAAIEALERIYFDEDREVRWNAALALARLGSARGKPLLLDMLDRDYWEREVKVRIAGSTGTVQEYPMPAPAVNRYLAVTVEAAGHLNDEEVWAQIVKLAEDVSVEVKESVRVATEHRQRPAA